MPATAQPRLVFRVAGREFGVPVGAVSEVTPGGVPRLVPLVPLAVGGILNVRGEPLLAVDAGALLLDRPAGARRHVVVFGDESLRFGILVDLAARMQTEPGAPLAPGDEAAADTTAVPVCWIECADGRVGLVEPADLLARARRLLAPAALDRGQGGESCPTGF
jgi:chemotaxis signal transduction protein